MCFHPSPLEAKTPRRPKRRDGRPSGPRTVTDFVLQFRTRSRSPTMLAWRPSTFGSIEVTLDTYPLADPKGPWPKAAGALATATTATAGSARLETASPRHLHPAGLPSGTNRSTFLAVNDERGETRC